MAPTQSRSPWYGPPAWLQPLLVLPGLVSVGGLVLAAPPAANLPDPTRPPPALQVANAARNIAARLAPAGDASNPQALGQPGAGQGGYALPVQVPQGSSAGEPEARTSLPVLQAVQVPNRGSPTAMLDGRLVKVGDTVHGLQVLAIDQQGVTLKGSGASQRLSLLGRESKQPAGSIVISRSTSYSPAAAGAANAPAEPGRSEPAPPRTGMPLPPADNGDTPTASASDSPMAAVGKPRP